MLILLMLMAVIIGITIQGYNSIIENLEATNKEASKQGAAGNVRFGVARLIMFPNDYIITEKEHYRFMFEQQRARVGNYQKKLSEFELSSNELAITDSISANLDSIYVYADQIFTIPRPRSSPEAIVLMEILDHTFGDAVNRKTTEFSDLVFRRIEEHRIQSARGKEQMLNTIYTVFFLGLMASLVVVYLVVKKIAKPITMVAKAADSIAKGDYSQRPMVSTRDEVGKLARSVSRMAEEIEGTHRNLEARKHFTENIVATVPSGLLVIGKNLEVLSVNRSFCELFNVKRQQVVGQTVDAVLQTLGLSQKCRDAIAARTPFRNLEYTCSIAGKGELTLNLSLSGIRLAEEEEEEEALIVIDDITERKRAELLRWRSSQVLESIAGDQALPQVLEGLVRAIEEYLPEIKGSVLLLDATGKRLRHGAAPSLPDDYNAAIDGLVIGPRVGSCGTAAYEKRLVIVEDIQTDPLWADFRDLAGKHGLRACWSQPIIDREGAVLGTFALYYHQPRKPTEAALELINTAAHIAGIAIKRKQAEEEIRQAHQQYEELVNSIDGIVWEADARTFQFSFVSKQAERLLGYPTERWITEPSFWKNHIHTDDREWVASFCINATAEKKSHEFDYRMVAADGRVVWLRDIVVVVLKDEQPEMLRGVMIDITERKRVKEENRLLLTLKQAIMEAGDFDSALGVTLQMVCESTAWDFGEAWISSRDGTYLECSPSWYSNFENAEIFRTASEGCAFAPGVGLPGRVWASKKPAWIPDVTVDANFLRAPFAKEVGFHAAIGIPILANSNVVAVICFFLRQLHQEDEGMVALVSAVAAELGMLFQRKRAEEALRESEHKHRIVADFTYDWEFWMTPEGRFVYVSPSCRRISGYAPEEFAGAESMVGIVHPDEREDVQADLKRALLQKVQAGLEFRIVLPDGSIRWVEMAYQPVSSEGGEFVGVRGSIRDITERKQAEEELKKLSSAVEQTADIVFITDRDGIIEYVNPAFEKSTGYTKEEAMGKTPRILKSGRQTQAQYELLWRTVLSGMVFSNVVLNKRKSGEEFYSEQTITPIKDMHGIITHFVSTNRDITERKRAEEALRQSEQKYRSIFEESKDVLYISTPDGRFVDINPAGVELFGYASKEELLGVDITRDLYWDPAKRNEFRRLMEQQGYVQDLELELRRRDGRKLTVLETATAVRDNDGNLIAYRGFLRDITAQRVLEEQFRQAQKMESLGTLAGGIAHDFNNILGIIMGHSSLLEHVKAHPAKVSQSIEAITKATERGASLVKQLLTFARKTETVFQSLNINDIIDETYKLIRETFPKTITIATAVQPELPFIIADATHMHQVLVNLYVNARDAMPKGGRLTITTTRQSGEELRERHPKLTAQEYVVLSVADTGMGMNEETKRRIFEPFFTTKGIGKGTGLGLSLVFGIIQHHHGFIDVLSALGEGTTFTVYLPIPERAPEVSPRARKGVDEIAGGTETILVIEDEEMLRELLKAVLVSKGYTVIGAEDGRVGFEQFKCHQEKIALVISDLGLPGLSGEDVLKKIREVDPHAKVIFASGFIDPQMKSELYKAGAKHFIQKPYSHDEVLQKIREVIDSNG